MKLRLLLLLFLLLFTNTTAPLSAQRPDAPTYAQRGPYAVGTREFTIADDTRPLKVTVWYPALNPDNAEPSVVYNEGIVIATGSALRDAPPDAGSAPYPLIVFSHGSGGIRFQSAFYTEHLASHGFVVIAPDHPGNTVLDAFFSRGVSEEAIITNFALRPLDVLRVIDYAETLNAADGALTGLIDLSTIGVSGHSFGGYTALSVGGAQLNLDNIAAECAADATSNYGCAIYENRERIAQLRGLDAAPEGLWDPTTDPRIQSIVLLAPSSGPVFGAEGVAPVQAPTMILVGSQDAATVPERDAYPVYEWLTAEEKALVVFENAGHYIFVIECSRFPQQLVDLGFYEQCSDRVWDMQRAHDLTNHFGTAFLLYTLTGDQAARQALIDEHEFVGIRYAAETP